MNTWFSKILDLNRNKSVLKPKLEAKTSDFDIWNKLWKQPWNEQDKNKNKNKNNRTNLVHVKKDANAQVYWPPFCFNKIFIVSSDFFNLVSSFSEIFKTKLSMCKLWSSRDWTWIWTVWWNRKRSRSGSVSEMTFKA